MQRVLTSKLSIIALLSLLLLIPLGMIESQIGARSARQDEVTRNIAESAAGQQTLVAPVLLVKYRTRVARRSQPNIGGPEQIVHDIVERSKLFPAQRVNIEGDLRVDTLTRGLYRVRLYHLASQIRGTTALPERLGLDDANVIDAKAFLVVGISDPRGIGDDPVAEVNGKAQRLLTGTAGGLPGQGMHIELGAIDPNAKSQFDFALPLKLTGLESLAIAPTAESTRVKLHSDWPHPSFQGRFLPQTRSVGADGFDANWQVSSLARDFDKTVRANAGDGRVEALGVALIDPVNVYLKSERAVKYGVLFVALTFAGLFLTEMLRRLAVHPLQYLLVGLALAIFFLLLVALSEHLDFALAYALSAAACVLLLTVYLAGALGGLRRGLGFGAGIAALYGVLYGVLASEDNALLMGTLLLFMALATTMIATRHFNWYRVVGNDEERADAPSLAS